LYTQLLDEGIISGDVDHNITHLNREYPTQLNQLLEALLLFGQATSFCESDDIVSKLKPFKNLIAFGDPYTNSIPLRKKDNPSHDQLLQAAKEIAYYKDFITPYLYEVLVPYFLEEDSAWGILLGLKKKKLSHQKLRHIIGALPELALYYASDLTDEIDLSKYPKEAVDIMEYSIVDETLLPALLLTANEPKKLIAESHYLRKPILSGVIKTPKSLPLKPHGYVSNLSSVVKLAFSRSGLELPKVQTVEQVLRLSDDDRIVSLRSLVGEFVENIRRGNVGEIIDLKARLDKAVKSLSTISKRKKVAKWSFVLPIAGSLIEVIMGMFPIASIAVCIGLETYDKYLDSIENKNRWAWLFADTRLT